jgi:hypothetical protein
MIFFVADVFAEQFIGGAELTSEAIIRDSLLPVHKVNSSHVDIKLMTTHSDKFWIFGNFAGLNEACIVYAAKNLNYSVLEYDYKYCNYRSPEKHILTSGECNCEKERRGKLVSIFFKKAKTVWFMSENQRQIYLSKLPFLNNTRVLSSVLSRDNLRFINSLDTSNKNNKWVVLKSQSWVKGTAQAIETAENKNLEYEAVSGLSHRDFLKKLANSKGLIYTPPGSDTCPRMVIEAKLLDCELVLNDNVQHKDEEWFQSKDSINNYLSTRTSTFWAAIEDECHLNLPTSQKSEGHIFNIIVPFYNAGPWIGKCLNSIKRQTHNNYRCFLIDDLSTDNTVDIIKQETAGDERFILIQNTSKCYALKNIVDTIVDNDFDDNDINILLDGDDWFSSINSLSYLAHKYSTEDCLLTYGNYVYYPTGMMGFEPSAYPPSIIESNSFREDKWRASHLRTFKTVLFEHLDLNDLKNAEGEFYKTAYDQALMLPLLEIAGKRSSYINQIMHVYNRANPLNVDKTKQQLQHQTAQTIRTKPKYTAKF